MCGGGGDSKFSAPSVIQTDPRSAEQRQFQNQLMQLVTSNLMRQKTLPSFGQAMPNIFQQIYGTAPSMLPMGGGYGGYQNIPSTMSPGGSTPPAPGGGGPFTAAINPVRPSAGIQPISSGSRMIRSGVGAQYPSFGSMWR